jgi:hypothetical protein
VTTAHGYALPVRVLPWPLMTVPCKTPAHAFLSSLSMTFVHVLALDVLTDQAVP